MTGADKNHFSVDATGVDLDAYSDSIIKSLRIRYCKETEEQMERAENGVNYLRIIHYLFKYFVIFAVIGIIYAFLK